MNKSSFLSGMLAGGLCAGSASLANAEVIYHETTPPSTRPSIDFDQDGSPELTFRLGALASEDTLINSLSVRTSATTEILMWDGVVADLDWGATLSEGSGGEWHEASEFGKTVWTVTATSSPVGTGLFAPPSFEPLPPPPPQDVSRTGVGMPGFGSFLGVRFLSEDGWHYGWVRFGIFRPSIWPDVLGYAYEAIPDQAILTGAGIDSDADGVEDLLDECPETPEGEIVDADGCSIGQLTPCDGPWRNHGEYIVSLINTLEHFLEQGLITQAQAKVILFQEARSDCGKRN